MSGDWDGVVGGDLGLLWGSIRFLGSRRPGVGVWTGTESHGWGFGVALGQH